MDNFVNGKSGAGSAPVEEQGNPRPFGFSKVENGLWHQPFGRSGEIAQGRAGNISRSQHFSLRKLKAVSGKRTAERNAGTVGGSAKLRSRQDLPAALKQKRQGMFPFP